MRITAVNDAGTGPSSDTAYEEAVALPTAPTSFTAVVTAELTIDLTWVVPADTGFLLPDMARVTTFVLEQSETSTFDVVTSNLLDTPATPTALSRIVTGLTKGTTYYYRIYTENVAGRSTAYAAANEQAITVPNAPTIVAEITGELEVRFTWVISTDTGLGEGVTPPRPITGYVLQITEEPTPPSANPTFSTIYASYNEGISATTRTLSGLGKGNTYFARILARNDAGSGPYSDTDNKQALTRPSPPNVTIVIPDGFNLLSVSFIPPPDTGDDHPMSTGLPRQQVLDTAAQLHTHAPTHPFIHEPMHPYNHPCTHAPIYPCTHEPIQSPMHPCTHLSMHPCTRGPGIPNARIPDAI